MKKYSIVIITSNRRNILKNCLDKLRQFDIFNKAEVIVVEASNENDFIYDDIKYIKIPISEKGFSNQRNIGVKNANCQYIIFIDDDVEITENWFNNFTKIFENYEYKYFGAMGVVFPKKTNLISFVTGILGHPGGGFRLHNSSNNKIISLSQVATCNTIINKKIIEDVGYFDPKNKYGSEDSELCLRIIEKYGYNKFIYIPDAFVWHYSPEKIFSYIRWYFKRGMADAQLLLSHKLHLRYFIQTSFILKLIIVIVLSFLSGFNFLIFIFLLWYFSLIYRYRFMLKYFGFYDFKFIEKLLIFFIFPFLKALSDFCFDLGRIYLIYENIIHRHST